MKHFHMMMALITVLFFCYSAFCIFNQKAVSRAFFIASHVVYALVAATGLMLLYMMSQVVAPPHWVFAKIILMIMAVSAMVKARRSLSMHPDKPERAKAGVFVAAIALTGVLYLAIAKPMLHF